MAKRNIRDLELQGKKVLMRVDFNVPMKNGVITDKNRIIQAVPTINYALDRGAKVILFSHLGRVKTEEDLKKNSLEPVARELAIQLGKKVVFIDATRGKVLEDAINELKDGEVLMFQNTRYEDLDGKKESKNNPELGENTMKGQKILGEQLMLAIQMKKDKEKAFKKKKEDEKRRTKEL